MKSAPAAPRKSGSAFFRGHPVCTKWSVVRAAAVSPPATKSALNAMRKRRDPNAWTTLPMLGGIGRRSRALDSDLVSRGNRRRGGLPVHAVVVKVNINDEGAADRALRDEVVPRVKQAPGFVAGYWTRKANTGLSMAVFESEDAAKQAAERVPSMVPDAVTLEDVEVREV